jgi:hypothetical protein
MSPDFADFFSQLSIMNKSSTKYVTIYIAIINVIKVAQSQETFAQLNNLLLIFI